MGTKKISQLTSITGASPSDILVIVHSGVTYQIPFSGLTSTLSINQNNESDTHSVYSGSNIYVKSELHEDLTQPYGSRYVYIGHVEVLHDPTQPEKFGVYAGETDSYNLISGHGTIDNYLQLNIMNSSSGTTASADIVATNDAGDEENNYIDFGINSSQYNNTNLVGGPNDAYIYSTGNDLYIGNAKPNHKVVIFNGGYNAIDNAKIFIHPEGVMCINSQNFNETNPSALTIYPANGTTYNLIQGIGNVDSYSQFANVNSSTGTNASADIVAYNNIDPVNQLAGFIDMGINSTNYVYNGIYPGSEGDGYLFTDSEHLLLGSIATGYTKITLFVGGVSEIDNSKLILTSNSGHTMTDDFTISGSTTITEHLILPQVISLNFVNDAAAAIGGVPLGGIYHNNGTLKIRIT